MGLYTNILNSGQFGPKPRVGLDRASAHQLLTRVDRLDPSIGSVYAAKNEVAVIPEQTDAGAGDTYTLTVVFYGDLAGVQFTTASIAFDAAAATIEAAIDTAATGVVPNWTNGDISVTMAGAAGLDDGTVTLTFDGTSVDETPAVVTLTATGFTATGPIVRSTPGSTDRKSLQALIEMNVIAGTVHDSPNIPTDWVRPASTGQSRPRYDLIKSLAVLASEEDGTSHVYDTVKSLYPDV